MEGYDYNQVTMKGHKGIYTTMAPSMSQGSDVGIAVRTIKEFFKQKTKLKDEVKDYFRFSVSFFQIYNEKVFDLLNFTSHANLPGGKHYVKQLNDLKVRWNQRDEFVVENLFTYDCDNAKEAITLYNQGIKNKVVTSHKMNHASSRSHCIFCIQVD